MGAKIYKPHIIVDQTGPSGNVFEAMANAIKALNKNGEAGKALALQADMVNAMHDASMTYIKMLRLIDQYVDVLIK